MSIGKASHTIVGGKYVWTLHADQALVNRDIPSVTAGADYSVRVEGRTVSGPKTCGYGVSLRDDYHSLYVMVVNADRTWKFGHATSYEPLKPIAQGTLTNLGTAANSIQVIAQGSTFSLYVNDRFISQVQDDRLKAGKPGIGVEVAQKGDVCVFEFDNFEVRAQ
jgi:hypothetical protein